MYLRVEEGRTWRRKDYHKPVSCRPLIPACDWQSTWETALPAWPAPVSESRSRAGAVTVQAARFNCSPELGAGLPVGVSREQRRRRESFPCTCCSRCWGCSPALGGVSGLQVCTAGLVLEQEKGCMQGLCCSTAITR